MEYNFKEIEAKWQSRWRADKTYKVETDPSRPKFYVLDMFPYPSGAGLHVGHPLGYIASDIYSRYKRLKGFNVLHPMGYDAFGLPAEQYAIQTGQHPAVTTEQNIARYREQLDKIGFSFDWDREVRTCDPGYYKWTQWAFLEMFSHWYDRSKQQARPVAELTAAFETSGTEGLDAACTTEMHFTAAEWNAKSEREQPVQHLRQHLPQGHHVLGALAPADGVNLLLRRLQNFGGLAHALLHHGGDLGGGLGHAPQQRLVPDDGRVLHHVGAGGGDLHQLGQIGTGGVLVVGARLLHLLTDGNAVDGLGIGEHGVDGLKNLPVLPEVKI